MLQGFRDFIMRGNVVDLAVAVVVGTAFAAVVDTMVSSIVTPLLNSVGGVETSGLGFRIISGNPETYVDLAAILNAVVVFLITAGVVYLVLVLPMNRFDEMRRARLGMVEEEEVSAELATLREIRDLLSQRGTAL